MKRNAFFIFLLFLLFLPRETVHCPNKPVFEKNAIVFVNLYTTCRCFCCVYSSYVLLKTI